MAKTPTIPRDHDIRDEVLPPPPPPLTPKRIAPRRSPAEEARTLLANSTVAALGTLTEDGSPWASLVAYAPLPSGSTVLMVSTLADHGRNLERDTRASLMVAHSRQEVDQLAHGRLTLQGTATPAAEDEREEARLAYLKAIPAANAYERFGDFSLLILRPERVRWVGGYGRMDSVTPEDYAAAEADPTAPGAQRAIDHLNADHADALIEMARNLGGYPDSLTARCVAIDRYGIDLAVETPRGHAPTRVGFEEAANAPEDLRACTVELARQARAGEAVTA